MQPENTAPPLAQDCSYQSAISRWRAFQETKAYDFLAGLPVIVWYSLTISNILPAFARDLSGSSTAWDFHFAISTLAHAAVIAFILLAMMLIAIRQPAKAKSKGLAPRISAFAGSFLMVAVAWLEPQRASLALTSASLLFTLAGIGFAVFALAHLGRSFSLMPEARRLVTDGPYAVIRHPLYLGEAISTLGMLMQYLSPIAVGIVALQFAFQIQRMKNEETVLRSLFPEYQDYMRHTARVVPGIY